MKLEGTISAEDLELCLFTDSVEEAIKHLQEHSINKFGLKPEGKERGIARWLFEHRWDSPKQKVD